MVKPPYDAIAVEQASQVHLELLAAARKAREESEAASAKEDFTDSVVILEINVVDPWTPPWHGDCSPEMRAEIAELQASAMPLRQPEDRGGVKYPLLSLKPFKSLVWTMDNEREFKVMANRLRVHANRIMRRTGRHFLIRKHAYRVDCLTLEVTRVPTHEDN